MPSHGVPHISYDTCKCVFVRFFLVKCHVKNRSSDESIQFKFNAVCSCIYGPVLMKFSSVTVCVSRLLTGEHWLTIYFTDGNKKWLAIAVAATLPISSFIYFILFHSIFLIFFCLKNFISLQSFFFLFICFIFLLLLIFHAIYCISLASPSHCSQCSCLILFKGQKNTNTLFKTEHKTA